MLIHRCGAAVRVWASAKVNLFLEVLGRRADGYHDLATLMVRVGLYDTLELRDDPSGAIRLHCAPAAELSNRSSETSATGSK